MFAHAVDALQHIRLDEVLERLVDVEKPASARSSTRDCAFEMSMSSDNDASTTSAAVFTFSFVPREHGDVRRDFRVGLAVETRHRHELGRRGNQCVGRSVRRVRVGVGRVLAPLGKRCSVSGSSQSTTAPERRVGVDEIQQSLELFTRDRVFAALGVDQVVPVESACRSSSLPVIVPPSTGREAARTPIAHSSCRSRGSTRSCRRMSAAQASAPCANMIPWSIASADSARRRSSVLATSGSRR